MGVCENNLDFMRAPARWRLRESSGNKGCVSNAPLRDANQSLKCISSRRCASRKSPWASLASPRVTITRCAGEFNYAIVLQPQLIPSMRSSPEGGIILSRLARGKIVLHSPLFRFNSRGVFFAFTRSAGYNRVAMLKGLSEIDLSR